MKEQNHILEEIIETQEDGSMPLSSYTVLHRDAVLAEKEKKETVAWAN